MQTPLAEEHDLELPRAGVAARRLRRFEDALGEWLASPEGQFASWCAKRQIEEAQPARS